MIKISPFDFDEFFDQFTDIKSFKILDLESKTVSINDQEYQIEGKSDFENLVEKFGTQQKPILKYDPIVFGHDQTERIVNVSVDDNLVHIFQELPDGTIQENITEMKYWILAPNRPNHGGVLLKGKQHYCWMKEYSNSRDWNSTKAVLYRRKADFFTINNPSEMYMVTNGITYFKGMKVSEVSILSFDIETFSLNPDDVDAKVCLISNTYRRVDGSLVRKLFSIDEFDSEQDMISEWCSWVCKMNPSILLGHNIYGFDLPYLDKRSGIGLYLGRNNSKLKFATKSSEKRVDCSMSYSYYQVSCFGREILDTFFLALTYDIGKKYESYGLKNIIRQEGLEKEGRTFIDASKVKTEWFDLEKRKLIKIYGEEDSDDSLKLFDLMVPAMYYFSQTVSKTFQQVICGASGSLINNIMTRAYFQDGYSLPKRTELCKIEGGISIGIPGINKNVMMIDLISYYPHTILQYELYDKIKDPLKHFLYLTKYFLEFRLKNKKLYKETKLKYYDDIQSAFKIGANSLFGALGAELMFNSPFNCAQITRYGRENLNKIVLFLTGKEIEEWRKIEGKDNDEELEE